MKSLNSPAAVVLAAGSGSRMGGVVKPLIRVGGRTIVQRVVQSLQAAGIERIVVVISAHTYEVRQTLIEALKSSAAGISFVEVLNGRDQMHSLQQGLRQLGPARADVMVCLTDQPGIDALAIALLQMAFKARPPHTDMVVPCVNSQPGNPVVLSSELAQDWQHRELQYIGKSWRQAHPQRVHHWSTDLTIYTTDLDTPGDLKAFGDLGLELNL